MNNNHILELTVRLSHALDKNYDVVNMAAVMSVISELEGTTITKEQLEATRLAKYINQFRRRTKCEQLARRAKSLLKKWREMVGMKQQPPQSALDQVQVQQQPTATATAATGKDMGRCVGGGVTALANPITASSLTISANSNVYNNCSNSNKGLDLMHTDNGAVYQHHHQHHGDSSSGCGTETVLPPLKFNRSDNLNHQHRISFANIFRCNEQANSSTCETGALTITSAATPSKNNKLLNQQMETFIIDQSSNSNSNVSYMRAQQNVVPAPIIIDIQDSNSAPELFEMPATSTKIKASDGPFSRLTPTNATAVVAATATVFKPNSENSNAKKCRKDKKRHNKESDLCAHENRQTEQMLEIIDDTTVSLSHHQHHQHLHQQQQQQLARSKVSEPEMLTPFLSEQRLLSNATTVSNISEVLSLSNSSMSSMFPTETLGTTLPHRLDDPAAKLDLSPISSAQKELTFAGKFNHQGGSNATAATNFVISAIVPQDQLPRNALACADVAPTANEINTVEEKVPKKRGRKKGSKGVDSVIAKETSLSSQILISPLGSCGKKVKTTKELYAEMQNRKLGTTVPMKSTSPLPMMPLNWASNAQPQQQLSRPTSSCSDTSLNSPRTLDACSTNATMSTLATRSTPDNFLAGLQPDEAESVSDTFTSGEPSRDSTAITKSTRRRDMSIDSNSNTLLPTAALNREPNSDSKKPIVPVSTLAQQRSHATLLTLEKQLEDLLRQLPQLSGEAAAAAATTGVSDSILCSCKVIEMSPAWPNDGDDDIRNDDDHDGDAEQPKPSVLLYGTIKPAVAQNSPLHMLSINKMECEDEKPQPPALISAANQLLTTSGNEPEPKPLDVAQKSKPKKSIFDLDFDDGEDPLHTLMAEAAAIRQDGIDAKDAYSVKAEANTHTAAAASTKNAADKRFTASTTVTAPTNASATASLFVPSAAGQEQYAFSIAPAPPQLPPVYQVLTDPDCAAKQRFEIQTQQITQFHVNALHNCYIPNINGNWDYGGHAVVEPYGTMAAIGTPPLDMMVGVDSVAAAAGDGSNVVPKYGSLVSERLQKDLSGVQFSVPFQVRVNRRAAAAHLEQPDTFLGVAQGLLSRQCAKAPARKCCARCLDNSCQGASQLTEPPSEQASAPMDDHRPAQSPLVHDMPLRAAITVDVSAEDELTNAEQVIEKVLHSANLLAIAPSPTHIGAAVAVPDDMADGEEGWTASAKLQRCWQGDEEQVEQTERRPQNCPPAMLEQSVVGVAKSPPKSASKRKQRPSQAVNTLKCDIIAAGAEHNKPSLIKRLKIAYNGDATTRTQIAYMGGSNSDEERNNNNNIAVATGKSLTADDECAQFKAALRPLLDYANAAESEASRRHSTECGDGGGAAEGATDALFTADSEDISATLSNADDDKSLTDDEPNHHADFDEDSMEVDADADDDEEYDEEEYNGDYHEVVTSSVNGGNNHIVLTIKKTPSKTNSPSSSSLPVLLSPGQAQTQATAAVDTVPAVPLQNAETVTDNSTTAAAVPLAADQLLHEDVTMSDAKRIEQQPTSSALAAQVQSASVSGDNDGSRTVVASLPVPRRGRRVARKKPPKLQNLLFFPHELHRRCFRVDDRGGSGDLFAYQQRIFNISSNASNSSCTDTDDDDADGAVGDAAGSDFASADPHAADNTVVSCSSLCCCICSKIAPADQALAGVVNAVVTAAAAASVTEQFHEFKQENAFSPARIKTEAKSPPADAAPMPLASGNNGLLLSFNTISSAVLLTFDERADSAVSRTCDAQPAGEEAMEIELAPATPANVSTTVAVEVENESGNKSLLMANQLKQLKLPPNENCDVYKRINNINSNNTNNINSASSNNNIHADNLNKPLNLVDKQQQQSPPFGSHDMQHDCVSQKSSNKAAEQHYITTTIEQQQQEQHQQQQSKSDDVVDGTSNDTAAQSVAATTTLQAAATTTLQAAATTTLQAAATTLQTPTTPIFDAATAAATQIPAVAQQEYLSGLRAVDEDVHDDAGNNCARIQHFKEWHQVLQLRSYNDELLTVLPYVVLE